MRINANFHCGIKTLLELAKNTNQSGLMQKDISLRQGISVKFLDHIISSLKVKGLIYRDVGKNRGYKLTMAPSEISVYQIYRAFEPEMNINPCLSNDKICLKSQTCGARCFLKLFNEKMKYFMLSYTLKDLIELESGDTQDTTDSSIVRHKPCVK